MFYVLYVTYCTYISLHQHLMYLLKNYKRFENPLLTGH